MSREEKKAPRALAHPSATSSTTGAVYAVITRDQNEMRAALPNGELPQAQATFAADCGVALQYEGYPELRFGQRQRTKAGTLSRLLVVRYPTDVFVRRAGENESFRTALEDWLASSGSQRRGAPGYFSDVLLKADGSEPVTVTVDADGEWILRVGERSAITFVTTSAWELYQASSGRSDSLMLYGPVEVTMPPRVLADVLLSWKTAADQMPHR